MLQFWLVILYNTIWIWTHFLGMAFRGFIGTVKVMKMAINTWLILDRSSINRKYSKKAIKQGIVLSTWKKMLKNKKNLPENWLKSPRVLVGIDQMEHHDSIPDNPDDPP
jgi:hypothetical protein